MQQKYLIIIIVATLILVSSLLLFRKGEEFSASEVDFKIIGGGEVEAGEPQNLSFIYKNHSKKPLENLKLILDYPEGILDFQTNKPLETTFNLGGIDSRQEKSYGIQISLFGQKDDVKTLKAKLEFSPLGSNKIYSKEDIITYSIKSVPLFLVFDIPPQIISNQEINFSFKYISKSKYIFPQFGARVSFPSGFQFSSALPSPTKGENLWIIGDLKSKAEGEIKIKGNLKGIKEENKQFGAELGIIIGEQFLPLYRETGITKIIKAYLFLEQLVNGKSNYSANPGELLEYSIKYKNLTREKLREVFITASLESRALDLKSLEVVEGEFDGQTQSIIWRAASSPKLQELPPNAEGEVKFFIRVKKDLPIESAVDKNFSIKSRAKIDMNPQYVPLSLKGFQISNESEILTKINSQLLLSAKGYYRHQSIENSGPLPPKVGETTTYTIVWQVGSLCNDLKETIVEAKLPANVTWKDNFLPRDFNIKYQPYTGKIIWEIGNLEAGSGLILPSKEIAFQVALRPTQDLIGKPGILIEDIKASAKDSFTGKFLEAKAQKIATNIIEDLTSKKEGVIIQ